MSGIETAALLRTAWTLIKGRSMDVIPLFLVPLFVLASVVAQFSQTSPITGAERGVAAVALKATAEDGGSSLTDRDAMLLIVEPDAGEILVPWRTGYPRSYWLSLTGEDYHRNRDRLDLGTEGFSGQLPLFGVSGPLAIVADGVTADSVFAPGRPRITLEDLRLYSSLSAALSFAGFLVATFAFGLIARLPEDIGEEA